MTAIISTSHCVCVFKLFFINRFTYQNLQTSSITHPKHLQIIPNNLKCLQPHQTSWTKIAMSSSNRVGCLALNRYDLSLFVVFFVITRLHEIVLVRSTCRICPTCLPELFKSTRSLKSVVQFVDTEVFNPK